MIGFWVCILFFVALGVILIVKRRELAYGMAMLSGASTPPGCAVAVGLMLFGFAIAGIVLYRMGLLGPF